MTWLSFLVMARYVNAVIGLSSHGLVDLFSHGMVNECSGCAV